MKLSVVILNYNVRYFLELCLNSVEAAIADLDAEIIVVDNNSEDDSCQMVKTHFPNVNLIEHKNNDGFSKGNNLGVKQAKGEYICILNPDTVVAEDTFSMLLQFADSQSNLGIVGCRLIDGTGHFLPESKRNIPKPVIALKKLLGNPYDYYANQINEFEIGEVPIFVGAFMFMKQSLYNEVGGFDEDYFMYGEDVDISYKVLTAGYTNYYNGNTSIIHYKGESTLKDVNYAKRFYGAMQIFYKKHFKKNWLFNMMVWLGIKGAYLMRTEPKKPHVRVDRYVVLSSRNCEFLKAILNKPFEVVTELPDLKAHTEIIFDAKTMTYKGIIELIDNYKTQKGISFKILSENHNFILGSNSSKNRGEVILVKNN
ncbi:glycosyl transferase family 2 [Hanstruepera neustonica]|uniref:Glycosyl transferase family 2 n=1 Tax=Hanstruepera neustonica TaxID=1445657 RepID=A0A2K1E1A4_9FLAO|nr:glycosyltransferase family 2 protein [Hanstruepera neustonica]PNQ74055.1 glycosyl transferase family 2 [Hanstruepera neustonica]